MHDYRCDHGPHNWVLGFNGVKQCRDCGQLMIPQGIKGDTPMHDYRTLLMQMQARNQAIKATYDAGGVTMAELGRRHGISAPRVRQIIARIKHLEAKHAKMEDDDADDSERGYRAADV